MELRIGDVLEVAIDFDAPVVSVGDRAIHLGRRYWHFVTRFPTHGAAPIYDSNPSLLEDGWIKIVDHLANPPEPETAHKHESVRPKRAEHFAASVERHASAVREIWKLDQRFVEANLVIDNLITNILADEPDLLWNVDLGYQFFLKNLRKNWWQTDTRLTERIESVIKASIKRLEEAGRICQTNGLRYRLSLKGVSTL